MLRAAPCTVLPAVELLWIQIAGGFVFYGLGKNFQRKTHPSVSKEI